MHLSSPLFPGSCDHMSPPSEGLKSFHGRAPPIMSGLRWTKTEISDNWWLFYKSSGRFKCLTLPQHVLTLLSRRFLLSPGLRVFVFEYLMHCVSAREAGLFQFCCVCAGPVSGDLLLFKPHYKWSIRSVISITVSLAQPAVYLKMTCLPVQLKWHSLF